MQTNLSVNNQKMDNNNPPVALDGPESITLTVAAAADNHKVALEFNATAQPLIVDWGDGSAAETYTNVNEQYNEYKGASPRITHTYAGSGAYTVQVKGERLTRFEWYGSGVTALDVSKCTALAHLRCDRNQLTALDVSKCTALQTLYCDDNQLTALDVSKCTALQTLYCDSNQLTALDVSKCPALNGLSCGYNQLTALDVSKCTALECLLCGSNQLTALDVSKCTTLQNLYCDDNQLTTLDVSGCTALRNLRCDDHQLTKTEAVSKARR
jgi:Leucine-rich repeat (LRR) protein